MDNNIPDYYNGILNIKDGFYVAFSFNNNMVTLCPTPDKIDELNTYAETEVIDSEKGTWMYGTTETGNKVAFFRKKKLYVDNISTHRIGTIKFYVPITIMEPTIVRPYTEFDSIEFFGGVVDVLFPPSYAMNKNFLQPEPLFYSKDDYEKSFDTVVNGEKITLTYSVNVNYKTYPGQIPDFHKTIHSTLRLSFDDSHSFYDILKYYRYAHILFMFCTGRQNVNSEVRLYKENKIVSKQVRINEDFENFANDILTYDKVISFLSLDDKFPDLFKLLNEKNTAPNLLFLPEHNKYYNFIRYNTVTDICNSLDKEYSLINEKEIASDREQAKELFDSIDEFIDSQVEISNYLKSKAKSLLGPLKSISPSLKEKIAYITDLFFEKSKEITEQMGHDNMGITFYDRSSFDKMVSKFVDIRNKSAHSGICWNEGSQIAPHLMLYIYYCILNRVGFEVGLSTNILFPLFEKRF